MSIHAEVILDLIKKLPNIPLMLIIEEAIFMEIASRNTIHKSIMWLKNNSYISVARTAGDTRVKKCYLTKKGKYYLDQL